MRQKHVTLAKKAPPARIWPVATGSAGNLLANNPMKIEQIRTNPYAQNTQHTQNAASELARLDGPTRPQRPISCHSTPKTRPTVTKTFPKLTKPDQTCPHGSHDLPQNTGIPPCSGPEKTFRRSNRAFFARTRPYPQPTIANQCPPPIPKHESDRRHR